MLGQRAAQCRRLDDAEGERQPRRPHCLLNPKAYAFMLAVFPAFIHSAQHSIAEQAVRLGAIVAITQVMVYGAVALFVASAALLGGSALTLVFGWRPLVL